MGHNPDTEEAPENTKEQAGAELGQAQLHWGQDLFESDLFLLNQIQLWLKF